MSADLVEWRRRRDVLDSAIVEAQREVAAAASVWHSAVESGQPSDKLAGVRDRAEHHVSRLRDERAVVDGMVRGAEAEVEQARLVAHAAAARAAVGPAIEARDEAFAVLRGAVTDAPESVAIVARELRATVARAQAAIERAAAADRTAATAAQVVGERYVPRTPAPDQTWEAEFRTLDGESDVYVSRRIVSAVQADDAALLHALAAAAAPALARRT